ncbi:Ribonuclease E [bioreactor metagenome]|uniref:Ribonuclease E n=1 Tax=bioreactor metagenome TaxID=1076179 RepID=A0A644YWF8_9ZZZZ
MFDYYGLETEVLALRNSKIILPSGGNIVIDNTEAMHVIDVNSAKNIKGSQRVAILNTNMEAAKAIAEQVRLRNIGGIILVDFIDMKEAEDREKVLKLLKEGFKEDKNNPTVYPFTELNLVQISRKRYGKSIYDYILEPCDTCKGKGNKIRLSYLSNIIRSKISRIKAEQNVRDILIELDSIYEKEIKENILSFVTSIEGLDRNVYINFIPHLESFKVEPLLFSNQIRNLEKLRVFQWDEVSII